MENNPRTYKFPDKMTKDEGNGNAEKKMERVVTGPVKTKKKGELAKFADIFISEDIKNVKSYVFMDVLVPAIKKAISDIVTDGIDMILYGSTGGRKSRGNASKIAYTNFYDRKNDRRNDSGRGRASYSYDDISIESRGEAEEVLDRMCEAVETYGVVSVADFYELVGVQHSYTDNKYGWTKVTFRNVGIKRARDGYQLDLPRAIPID
jgi:hypothetical protein